ncbi:hypothetical protein D5086_007059 [Populus alba]|uniref:Uncharacterized protein n=1 Tax=Populus alba TaxID=43335 RepID=A0ACC4CMQ4_POPAL
MLMKPSKVLENQALSWLKLLHKNAQPGTYRSNLLINNHMSLAQLLLKVKKFSLADQDQQEANSVFKKS